MFFNILKLVFVLGCLGLIALSIVAVSIVQYAVESTENDSDWLELSIFQRSATSYIMARTPGTTEEDDNYQVYQRLVGDSNSMWASLDEIPVWMQDAAIATEDANFLNHNGFSLTRTIYAAVNEVFHFQRSFGGSTLDQQLVKNVTGENEVLGEDGDALAGYKRKIREIYRAWVINQNYSKQTILESYLNTIPLTGTIVGVRAGAEKYFYVTDLDELSLAQCAMIIGVTNAPGRFDPYNNPQNCLDRRNYVLRRMQETGKITEAECAAAQAEPLGLYTGARAPAATNTINSYFVDALFEEVIADYMALMNVNEATATRAYYNSGWEIYSTVDLALQEEMERVYEMGAGPQEEGYIFPNITSEVEVAEGGTVTLQEVGPQSAMVSLDYSGNIRGVVGGIGPKTGSLILNRATGSVRQVGSTMKPIAAYVLGIENGLIDYSSAIEDSGIMPNPDPSKRKIDPDTGLPMNNWPQNVFNTKGKGDPTPVVDAITESLNTVAVRVGVRVGIEDMFDFLVNTLHVTSLVEDENGQTDKALAPLVLGSMTHGMSPLELAACYQIFGNGGVYNSTHTYTKILDTNGNLVMEPKRISIQAISPETAYIMNRLLKNVLSNSGGVINGTARGMGMTYTDSVAKTGTTSDDRDRWIVGLTPNYVSAVWWGYDAEAYLEWPTTPSQNATILCWHTVMEAMAEVVPEQSFPERPSTVVEQAFCRDSGDLATENCPSHQTGYYNSSLRIPGECYLHNGGASSLENQEG